MNNPNSRNSYSPNSSDRPNMIVPENGNLIGQGNFTQNNQPVNSSPTEGTKVEPPVSSPIIPVASSQTKPNPSRKKWFILSGIILVLLIILIGIFIILGMGKTALGENLQDNIWESFIKSSNQDAKDVELTIKYQDEGNYFFKPSEFTQPFAEDHDTISPKDQTKLNSWNDRYSFTIDNPTVTGTAKGYLNLTDTDNPKVDLSISGALSNNKKDFEASLDFKLDHDSAFTKYNYNTNIEDLIKYLDGDYGQPSAEKNVWQKSAGLKRAQDFVKLFSLQESLVSNSRDAKRLADIRQFSSALELYYNDNNSYPDSDNGKPIGLEGGYLGVLPSAPTPPDGQCSDEMNNYHYETDQSNKISSQKYTLTFCIGQTTGGFEAGNLYASESGIQILTDCPAHRHCEPGNSFPKENELNPYQQLVLDNRIFKIKSFKGISLIDKTPVAHYSLELDKAKLENIIQGSLDLTFDDLSYSDPTHKQFLEELNKIILEKINVHNYDIWVGVTNKKIYRSEMKVNALSITKAMDYFTKALNDPNNPITKSLQTGLSVNQETSRDAQRVADARQMSSALELFYNDNNSYPPAENGKPIGLSPTYIVAFPIAPDPPDGECDAYHNEYWYTASEPVDEASSGFANYKLDFCLGAEVAGLPTGMSHATPQGIVSDKPTPDYNYQDNYYPSPRNDDFFESFKSTILNTIKELDFSAQIVIEMKSTNFGEDKNIEDPPNYKDEPNYVDDQSYFREDPILVPQEENIFYTE